MVATIAASASEMAMTAASIRGRTLKSRLPVAAVAPSATHPLWDRRFFAVADHHVRDGHATGPIGKGLLARDLGGAGNVLTRLALPPDFRAHAAANGLVGRVRRLLLLL